MVQKLNIQDIHIGETLYNKDGVPMQVVAIYHDGTVYLNSESNSGTSLRFDIKDLYRHWEIYEPLKKITKAEFWGKFYNAKVVRNDHQE